MKKFGQKTRDGRTHLTKEDIQEVISYANIIYFKTQVWEHTYWMGIKTAKCPMDMWVYQELLHKYRPDILIETGTLHGGSALFFAQMFDLIGKGEVVTIDIQAFNGRPSHPRINYLTGSSIDQRTIDSIKSMVQGKEKVMVILDSDHHADFKLKEMELYSQFVTPGSYLIAEDSCFDEFPAWPEYGPGPAKAIREFISKRQDFQIDRTMERHIITFSPKGFLKRIR